MSKTKVSSTIPSSKIPSSKIPSSTNTSSTITSSTNTSSTISNAYILKRTLENDIRLDEFKCNTVDMRNYGLNLKEKVPLSIRKVLQLDNIKITRFEVSSLIWNYIYLNGLVCKGKNKGKIKITDELIELLNLDDSDEVDLYNLQIFINKLY